MLEQSPNPLIQYAIFTNQPEWNFGEFHWTEVVKADGGVVAEAIRCAQLRMTARPEMNALKQFLPEKSGRVSQPEYALCGHKQSAEFAFHLLN